MAKYANTLVLDGGLNVIKNSATRMILISSYTAAQSYATVVANALCTITMAAADYTISGADGATRTLTTGAKSGSATAGNGAGSDLHIAFTDGTANVLWVTDETSNQAVASANTINFPALTYTSSQPA